MKIVASAWMKLTDGTTAFEEYGFVGEGRFLS